MFNFTKIFGLAGAALVFAGLASAQSTCSTVTAAAVIDRGEGTTELLPTITINCAPVAPAVAGTGPVNLQLFLSLPVTSKVTGPNGATEAQLSIPGSTVGVGAASVAASTVQGFVSGSSISFSGLTVPAAAFTMTINNVRVNASGAGVTVGGSPISVTGTAFVSGAAIAVNPGIIALPTLALLENGLAPTGLFNAPAPAAGVATLAATGSGKFNSPTVCQSNSAGFFGFYVQVNEGFPTAFKTAAGEASQVPVTATTSNTVVDGTRVQITFANVPANVSVYVPVGPQPSTVGADVLSYTTAGPGSASTFPATGTFPTSTQAAGLALPANSLAQVTISSGTGTAVFEESAFDNNNSGKFNIPVYLVNSAFAVPTGTTSGITATVSLSPIGSTAIPNFSANSATTLTTSVFTLCSTSLLFPFVTNQLGFDTGIAIANTSTDPTNSATPQSGTCTLNFYGSGAPSPNSVVTGSIGAATTVGPVYAVPVSSIAAGFQGYVIAACNFQYAHGFAFVTDGVGATGGLSQGYLAGVLTGRVTPESLGF